MRLPRFFTLLCCTASMGACLDNQLDEAEPKVYIAQQRDFSDYQDWMMFQHDTTGDHGGVLGTTTVYINQLPDAAEHRFAVGSIVLKTVKPVDSDELTVHAMTKRGSGFNPKGAVGWEYFELLIQNNKAPYILWRGDKPPSGEAYQLLLAEKKPAATGTGVDGDCNSCHAGAQDGMLSEDILALLR